MDDEQLSTPMGKGLKDEIKDLYQGEVEYKKEEVSDELSEIVDGPYGVIDPRYVGYNYLSYMFVNAGDSLNSGFSIDKEGFRDEQKALMMGGVLGDFDFIHRRADWSQYRHADFSVRAKDNPDLEFFGDVETYPIFTVGRWHGYNVQGDLTLQNAPNALTPIQAEIVTRKIQNPTHSDRELLDQIRSDLSDEGSQTLLENVSDDESPDLATYNPGDVTDKVPNGAFLGTSISINITDLSWVHHVIIGITVEEAIEPDNGPNNHELANEMIISKLQDNYSGWEMPYIVSGVGQSWGDIIVEMHIENVEHMNQIAQEIRDLDGIQSTKTYLLTESLFNDPLTIDDPRDLLQTDD